MTSVNYTLVKTEDHLRSVEPKLVQSSSLGMSLLYDELHNYELTLSFLQISTTDEVYLIDIKSVDISSLGPIFADPNTIKIFYSGYKTIQLLQTTYDWNIRSIVDLKPIYELIGDNSDAHSLETMLENVLDISITSYSGINWLQRPLTKEILYYAAQQVAYLHRALVHLQKQLSPVEQKVLETYFLQYPLATKRTETPLMYAFQLCHDYKIDELTTRLLIYRLIEFREQIGKENNVGAKVVLNPDQLRVLVSRKPTTVDELRKRELFEGYIKRYHQQILELIQTTMDKSIQIDPDGIYAELDEKFKKFYPYYNYLDENYEWPYEISLSTYRNRRGILRIIYDMIASKVEDRFMPYLITEHFQHQLAFNESIRMDLLRPKIDACNSIEDIVAFIYEQVELIYAMTDN